MRYLALVLALMLTGCATTKGKDTKVDAMVKVTGNTNCVITISPLIDQESLTGDIKELKADNRPDMPIEVAIPITAPALPISLPAAKDVLNDGITTDVIGNLIDSITPPTVSGGTTYVNSALKNGAYPPGYDWVHQFTTTEVVDNVPIWRLDKRFCIAETSSQAMFDNTPYLNGLTENFDGQFFIPHSNESKNDGAKWDAENCVLTGWNLSLGAWSDKPGKTLYLSTQGNPLE